MTLDVFATVLEWSREYGVLLLVLLLFGWLVLSLFSNMTARVDAQSIAIRDMREDLDEIKGEVRSLRHTLGERTTESD